MSCARIFLSVILILIVFLNLTVYMIASGKKKDSKMLEKLYIISYVWNFYKIIYFQFLNTTQIRTDYNL